MSRSLPPRLRFAAFAAALLLAASAAAAPAVPAARPAASRHSRTASPLATVWRWWLDANLRSLAGRQGSGVDPNGASARFPALPGYLIPAADQGSGVDPNGLR